MDNADWLGIPEPSAMAAAALQFQLSQTQLMSRDRLEAIQFNRLRSILRHARESAPYYSAYEPVTSWEDWKNLPLLSRKNVQNHGKELESSRTLKPLDEPIGSLKTSGSTGMPVEILTSQRAQLFLRAITLRDHLWHRRNFSHSLGVIKYFQRGTNEAPGSQTNSWGPSVTGLFNTGPCHWLNSATPVNLQYDWLLAKRPDILVTYPSILLALAELNRDRGKLLSFTSISTFGEAVPDGSNELAAESFGVLPTDIYSTQEAGQLALKCPFHDHYHIQSEMNYVELLNEQGEDCQPGEMGKVVVTPLHNLAMPLVRYAPGDYALAGEPTDCGITLPVVERVVGRTRNLLTYPDGSRAWPAYNCQQLMEDLPKSQFQLVQTAPGAITLKVASAEPVTPAREAMASATIREALGYPFEITIEPVAAIPRSMSGKFEDFVSQF